MCAVLAVSERRRGETDLKKLQEKMTPEEVKQYQRWEILLDLGRAVGCAIIFLSLALLTSPAPTCLFREGNSIKSYIPRYTSACICTTFVFVLSAFSQVRGVVTPPDPKEAASVPLSASSADGSDLEKVV